MGGNLTRVGGGAKDYPIINLLVRTISQKNFVVNPFMRRMVRTDNTMGKMSMTPTPKTSPRFLTPVRGLNYITTI